MANRFISSSMSNNNIRFKVQIVDFSTYFCKGYYITPEFGDEEYETKWRLLIHVYDGADHENFIVVRLKRDDHVTGEQYVSAKISIVNSVGYKSFENVSNVLFRDSSEIRILSVAKENLKGYLGLKKFFYLPNDTLTLQCDLTVHERIVSLHQGIESFQNNISVDESCFSESFAQSRFVKKADDYFFRRIRDFSIHAFGNRIINPEYRSESLRSKWSLAVYTTGDHFSESIDIRLMCRKSYEQQHQLVKVMLSITDDSGKVLLSRDKITFFTSSREVQLLSLTDVSDSLKNMKESLIPNDTLTLHCKMILFEQIDDILTTKEDFDKNVKSYGYSKMKLFLYLVPICFMLFLHLIFFIYNVLQIFCSLCDSILMFAWYFTSNTAAIKTALPFILGIILVWPDFIQLLPKKTRNKWKKNYKKFSRCLSYIYNTYFKHFIETRWKYFKQNSP